VSYSSGVTTEAITDPGSSTGMGVTISLSWFLGACGITVGGTSAVPATASGTYTDSTGVFAITGSINLAVTSVSGICPGISAGDPVSITGTITFNPKQTITSP
jgi:hypothetical protein